jgi:hypothetical protein
VAANGELRRRLGELDAELHVPPRVLCTDNAAMIASAARFAQALALPGVPGARRLRDGRTTAMTLLTSPTAVPSPAAKGGASSRVTAMTYFEHSGCCAGEAVRVLRRTLLLRLGAESDGPVPSSERLSLGVAARLSRYLQVLTQAKKMGKETISSQELSDYTHVNSTQIRRDLSGFGKFGKRGVGYNVEALVSQIRKILRTAGQHNIALLGAGHLGKAIASSDIFADHGFRVVAIFDVDRRRSARRSAARWCATSTSCARWSRTRTSSWRAGGARRTPPRGSRTSWSRPA